MHAKDIMQSWADAEWFLAKPEVPKKMTVTVFMVKGETNTDDLSPAPDAWSRPDIPLHALAMLKLGREVQTPPLVRRAPLSAAHPCPKPSPLGSRAAAARPGEA